MQTGYWKKGEFKLWILLLCAYHFFPFITIRGSIVMYAFAYLVPLVYMVLNFDLLVKTVSKIVYSDLLLCIIPLVLLTVAAVIIPIIYGTYDYTYFTEEIMTVTKIMFRMLFLIMLIKKNIPNADWRTFCKYFIFSCLLYIGSTLVMMGIPPIKNFFYAVVKEDSYSKALALETRYSTRYGWAGFSAFEYTFKCLLAIIFNNYFIQKNIKQKGVIWSVAITAILLLGTLFYGRIGTLAALIVLFFMALRLILRRPKIFMWCVVGLLLCVIALFVLKNRVSAVGAWFDWAFDLIINFINNKTLRTDSSDVLLNKMLFIPKLKTILIGDGRYTENGLYYMGTDAGIMRPLLFGGLIFAFVRYIGLYGILLWRMFKYETEKYEKIVLFWTLVMCILFEIKGEIIFSCLPILLGALILGHGKKTFENKE